MRTGDGWALRVCCEQARESSAVREKLITDVKHETENARDTILFRVKSQETFGSRTGSPARDSTLVIQRLDTQFFCMVCARVECMAGRCAPSYDFVLPNRVRFRQSSRTRASLKNEPVLWLVSETGPALFEIASRVLSTHRKALPVLSLTLLTLTVTLRGLFPILDFSECSL